MPGPELEVEEIPDADLVSRQIFLPQHYGPDERTLMAEKVFEFARSDGRRESLVWRKYKPSIDDVHALGCERQWARRATGKRYHYEGAKTSVVQRIRQIQIDGCGFVVRHEPGEGRHHAEVTYRVPAGYTLTTPQRLNLRQWLLGVFDPLERHECAEPPAATVGQ